MNFESQTGLTIYKFPFVTKDQLDAANNIIAILIQEKNDLEEKLKEAQDKIDELNERLDFANNLLSMEPINDDELMSYLRDEISRLTKERDDLIQERNSLEVQLNELKSDLKEANDEITKLKNENNNLTKEKNTLNSKLNDANKAIDTLNNRMINLAYDSMFKFTNIIYDEGKKELRVNNFGKFVKGGSDMGIYKYFEIEFDKYVMINDGRRRSMRFNIFNTEEDDVTSIMTYPSGSHAGSGIFNIVNSLEHYQTETAYRINYAVTDGIVYLTFSNFNLRNFLKYVAIEFSISNYNNVILKEDNGLRDLILLLSYGNKVVFKNQ